MVSCACAAHVMLSDIYMFVLRKGDDVKMLDTCSFFLGTFYKLLVAQSCPTLCDPVDFSPPGSSVHGILQAQILEWAAIPFSRGASQPRDQIRVSCITGGYFTI